jgi:hypothetical protein
MTLRRTHRRLLGTNSEWYWFTNMGPHGRFFSWHNEVPGHSDIGLLKRLVAQRAEGDPDFPEKARQVALDALAMESTDLIRRAIQVLTVVGTEADLGLIRPFADHPVEAVRKDARAALFERGYKRIPRRAP